MKNAHLYTWVYREAGSGPMYMPKMFWIHPGNRAWWRVISYWIALDLLGIE